MIAAQATSDAADNVLFAKLAHGCFVLALFLATLWDFRYWGVRVFDVAALVLLCPTLLVALRQRPAAGSHKGWLVLTGVITIYAAYGFLFYRHQSSLVLLIGGALFVCLAWCRNEFANLGCWLRRITWFHMAMALIQALTYHILGKVLDFHALYGSASRIGVDGTPERWAGLFQEPNSYCLTIFLLLVLCIRFRAPRVLIVSGALTMVASQSLWGIAGALLLIIAHELYGHRKPIDAVLPSLASLLIVAVITLPYMYAIKPSYYTYPRVIERLFVLHSDPSLRERYLQNAVNPDQSAAGTLSAAPPAEKQKAWQPEGTLALVLGSGLSTHWFPLGLPANGASLIWKAFGLGGGLLLLGAFCTTLRPLTWRDRGIAVAGLGFSMTDYPLFTYLFFWLWLACLLTPLQNAAAGEGTSNG